MKYKIKVITWGDGRKTYYAYVKKMFIWLGLGYDGSEGYASERERRDDVLEFIDKHFAGHHKVQKIEFEYIDKPIKRNNK